MFTANAGCNVHFMQVAAGVRGDQRVVIVDAINCETSFFIPKRITGCICYQYFYSLHYYYIEMSSDPQFPPYKQ